MFNQPFNWNQSYKIMIESLPSSASAAASAASHAAPQAASATATGFAHASHHIPHPTFGAPPSYPTYASFHRYGRRGPRLFPLLLVVGGGAWAYSHIKHELGDIRDDQEGLRREIRRVMPAQSQNQATMEVPMVAQEEKKDRRSRWERRWGHAKREEQPQMMANQQQPQMFFPQQQQQQRQYQPYEQPKMV